MKSRPVFFRVSRNRKKAASAPSMRPKALSGSIAKYSRGLALSVLALIGAPAGSHAVDYYWNTGTATWAGSTWSDTATTGGTTGVLPTSSDTITFNQSSVNGAETISLGADQSVLGITFSNTGTTLLQGGGVANQILTIGTSGITINSGAGAVTIGSLTALQNVAIALGGTQSWTNNSANLLTVINGIDNGANLLTIAGSGNTTISGIIGTGGTFSGGLTKNNTGTLTLTGANLYTGTTTINGGTLQVGNAATGSINGTTGTALTFGGNGSFIVSEATGVSQGMGTLTFSVGNGTITSTNNGGTSSLTFSSLAARTVGATGNFVLSGDTPGTPGTPSGGVLGTNNIVLTTGATASQLIDRGFFYNGSAYAAYDAAGFVRGLAYGTDTNAPAAIIGGGNLGVNDATQNVRITGAITAQGTASVNTINLGANAFTITAGQTLSVNGLLSTGNLTFGAVASQGTIRPTSSGGEIVVNANAGTLTLNSVIANNTNPSTLTKTGAGTLLLAGNNTGLTGTTYVNQGTLQVNGGNSIPAGTTIVQSGATLYFRGASNSRSITLNGGRITTDDLDTTYTGTITLTADSAITDNGTGSVNDTKWGTGTAGTINTNGFRVTITNSIRSDNTSEAGPLITGGGGLTLTATFQGGVPRLGRLNTYSGSTAILGTSTSVYFNTIKNVGGGSSSFGAPTTAANGTISLGSGTNAVSLVYEGTGNTTDRVINLAGTTGAITISQSGSGNLNFTSALTATGLGNKTLTLAGSTAGTGEIGGAIVNSSGFATALTKSGTGLWTLGGANTYTGVTTVGGGLLQLNNATALPGGIGVTGGTSALTFNGGVLGLGAGDFTRNLAAAGTVTGVNFTGTGGWAAYSADRIVNLGGASTPITWATANTGFNGQTLILGASSATHTVDLQNPIALGTAARTVQVDNGAAAVDGILSGVISSGAGGGLTKTGAGTLSLTNGANTYSGNTTISNGTLQIGAAGTVPTGAGKGNVVLDGGATFAGTLDLNGIDTTINGLSGVTGTVSAQVLNNVTATNMTLTVGNADATGSNFAGVIRNNTVGTGTVALTKTGSGTQILSGANTYTGATMISVGTLQIGSGSTTGTLSTSSAITNNAALVFNRSNTITQGTDFASTITGSGTVTQAGTAASTLVLSGSNSYGGVTNVNSGTLNIQHSNALGTATNTITVASGAKLQLQNGITVPSDKSLTISQPALVLASGGTETSYGIYTVRSFTTNGSLTVTTGGNVEYLVIAGGGGGGGGNPAGNSVGGGGGGAGGYRSSVVGEFSGRNSAALAMPSLTTGTYTIGVGAGGAGGATVTSGNKGADSFIKNPDTTDLIRAEGGGLGAYQANGGAGGSGGGASNSSGTSNGGAGTANQGFNGGNENVNRQAGGGGGAGQVGGDTAGGTPGLAGKGGDGIFSSITGVSVQRGGGGGGGVDENNNYSSGAGGAGGGGKGGGQYQNNPNTGPGSAGTANTGGGGGGGTRDAGGSGGSGIVVIRYVSSAALENVSGDNTWSGAITLGSNVAIGSLQDTLTLGGAIGDSGIGYGITKLGAGTVALSGSNTYTGATTVIVGTLKLNRTAADNTTILTDNNTATTSDIVINGGTLELAASHQIDNSGSINMSSGAFNFGAATGLTETIDKFTNSGGTFSTGANTLIGLGNTITWSGGTNTVNNGGNVQDLHIVISGGINTVEGGATGGVLQLNSGGTGLEMSADSTLTLNSDNAVAGKLLLKGDVSSSGGSTVTIANGLGLTNKGNIDLDNGTRTFTVADGAAATDMSISAVITNGSIIKDGAGTLSLDAANTYSGTTAINGGTLIANVLGALPLSSRSAVSFTGGATSTLSLGAAQEVASLTSTGAATVTLGSNTLTVGIAGANTTFAGSIGGTGNLIKDTNSTQVLSGTNAYTGTTTVNGGTLEVKGTLSGTSAVTVNTSGTLLLNNAATPAITSGANMTVADGKVQIANTVNNTNQTFGSLTLTGTSILDFGTGSNGNAMTFSSLSFSTTKLNVYNWSGSAYGAGVADGGSLGDGQDRLMFTSTTGIGTSGDNRIEFFSDAGTTSLGFGQEVAFTFGGGGFELVPITAVPEPATTALIGSIALCALIGYRERRRFTGFGKRMAARK